MCGNNMKNLIFILTIIFFCSCGGSNESTFKLDPSMPVEIGIESLKKNSEGVDVMNVYMINHQPVSGIQFEIEPKGFFEVDSVYGGRSEINNFQLHNNKTGRILGFSMSGKSIPESTSLEKLDNILFLVSGKFLQPLNSTITISPIIASSTAQKMDYKSIPFVVIGN